VSEDGPGQDLVLAFERLEGCADFDIYRRRKLAAGKPPTLQQLGEEMAITRERVRQLEARFEARLRKSVTEDPGNPINVVARQLAEGLGPAVPSAALPTALESLAPSADAALREPHRVRLLLALAGPYEIDDGWCLRSSFRDDSQELLERLTEEEPAPLVQVVEEFVRLGLRAEDVEPWLESCGDYVVIYDHVVRYGRSLAERGVAVLSLRGEPMTLQEIFEELGEQRSFRGFKSQMQGHPQVRRRGVKHYGLIEWGGEEYTSISDEMCQEIERRGGSIDLEELARALSRRFGVSPASVRMYAAGAQFSLSSAGRVAVAVAEAVPATKPLGLTRGCFRLPAGWAFRRAVDHDVLRGSGSAIPLGFAKELGLAPGSSLRLKMPFGSLNCSWPSHMAHIGSLRKAAVAFEAKEGDYLFVVATGKGAADVVRAGAAECAAAAGIERLALECGVGGPDAEAAQVAAALGLEKCEPGVLQTQIRQRLLQRDEDELAALVADDDDLLQALVDL
jgi:hypothetical protein